MEANKRARPASSSSSADSDSSSFEELESFFEEDVAEEPAMSDGDGDSGEDEEEEEEEASDEPRKARRLWRPPAWKKVRDRKLQADQMAASNPVALKPREVETRRLALLKRQAKADAAHDALRLFFNSEVVDLTTLGAVNQSGGSVEVYAGSGTPINYGEAREALLQLVDRPERPFASVTRNQLKLNPNRAALQKFVDCCRAVIMPLVRGGYRVMDIFVKVQLNNNRP